MVDKKHTYHQKCSLAHWAGKPYGNSPHAEGTSVPAHTTEGSGSQTMSDTSPAETHRDEK